MTTGDVLYDIMCRLDAVIDGPKAPAPSAPAAAASPAEDAREARAFEALSRLAGLGAVLGEPGNRRATLHRAILAGARELLEASDAALFLEAPDGGLILAAKLGSEDEVGWRPVLERALASAPVLNDPGAEDAPAALGLPLRVARPVAPGEDRRRIAAPAADDLLGVLLLRRPEPFDEVDALSLRAFGAHAATALRRDEGLRGAITDPLTGAFTRPQLNRELRRRLETFEAHRTPFAVLLVNIDRFAEVNEEYGHSAGDGLLAQVAAALQGGLRDGDLLFRYGGDTFALTLPETDAAGAEVAADKLRRLLAELDPREARLSCTASIGVAACPAHGIGFAELLKKADQALYEAKSQGRNRAVPWSPQLDGAAPRHDSLAGILTGDFATDYLHVATLLSTADALASGADLDEVLRGAVDRVIRATDAERGALMLREPDGALRTAVARGRSGEELELTERFSRSLPERVLRSGEAVCVVVRSDEARALSESFVQLELKTVFCAPLRARGATIGVLYTDGRALTGELRDAMLPFFTALAGSIALAIENARLRGGSSESDS